MVIASMRKIVFLLFVSLFIFGCQPTQMPPLPSAPGETPVGQAYLGFISGVSSNYAPPVDVFENNHTLFNITRDLFLNVAQNANVEFNVTVKYNSTNMVAYPYNLIYKYGYVYENSNECKASQEGCSAIQNGKCCNGWRTFQLSGKPVTIDVNKNLVEDSNSVWLNYSAAPLIYSVSVSKVSSSPALNYVIVYACKRVSTSWRCGCGNEADITCNKWMLQMFNVTTGAAPQPTITITSPTEGATVTTLPLTVQFSKSNAADKKVNISIDSGSPVVLEATATSYPISTLTNAQHTVQVELLNADNTILSPRQSARVTFTVTVAGPSITISKPTPNQVLTSSAVTVEFSASNAAGKKINVSVDGVLKSGFLDVSSTTYELTNLANGQHSVVLELLNQDGTSLSPRVPANVTFSVTPPTVPSITISKPTPNQVLTSSAVTVEFSASNAAGKKINVSVDGVLKSGFLDVSSTTYELTNLANGQHSVVLELLNQDGTSLSPRVPANVTFTIGIIDLAVVSFDFFQMEGNIVPFKIYVNNSGTITASQPIELNYTVLDGITNEVKVSNIIIITTDIPANSELSSSATPRINVPLESSLNLTVIAYINARRNITENNFVNNAKNGTSPQYGLGAPGGIGQ